MLPCVGLHHALGFADTVTEAAFFAALVLDGALAGVIYALVGLAFVVVYKASRMINFALGEWVMLASRLVASGFHGLGFGLLGAIAFGCAGMVTLAVVFSRLILKRLVGHPLISLIMVSIGLGILMRGSASIVFAGIPSGIPLPIPEVSLAIHGVPVSSDKLLAAAIAAVCMAALGSFFRWSRTGLALRAIASDQRAAITAGISIHRHYAISWALAGILSVLAGTLWTAVSGGGFGVEVLGLKVFPIVIIGGLNSISGTIVAAILVGVLESLAAGYLEPTVGGGFRSVASYLVLLAALLVRPYGLFGSRDIERV
jgi:branched-chain amino acid transport system permease protein